MLAPSPIVKQTAKIALSKRYLQTVAVCCVLIFSFFVAVLTAELVSVFAGVIGYFVAFAALLFFAIFPLLLGALYYFRRLLWEQQDSLIIIFKYFSSICEYKRAIKFVFLTALKWVVAAAVLFFPCLVVLILSNEGFYEMLNISLPIWTSNLWALNSFLVIVASFLLVFVMIKYYLAPFIFIANDDIDPEEAVNMSTIISKRTGADFVGLVLSFAGWIALSVFVAPIPFVLPYFIASYGVHCRFAITAYNCDVDRFNASVTPRYSTDE